MSWEFWVDRGGTFTDCIGVSADGSIHTVKVLSSDTAPVEGIRLLLERSGAIESGAPLPACRVKLGTTVATNALLTRGGVSTALVTDRGLGDVMAIGTQERPDLFALKIEKPEPLPAHVVEVGGRLDVNGHPVDELDEAELRRALAKARSAGARSVAVVAIHAYAFPERERRLRDIALEAGFEYVAVSHEVAREIGLLARGETTAVDAYLTPLLRTHVEALREALPGSHLRFMQSSGGLTDAERFRGPSALLSGPAGGVVGAARVARAAGISRAVGFDMGGTSTDVSLVRDGDVERAFETVVAGVRVKSPMLRIHTVAAGGGSLCRFDGFRLCVGPESAGAEPGPLCYGRPGASSLTLTDVNFFLGRIRGDRFPFPLRDEGVSAALAETVESLRTAGHDLDAEAVAAGFVEVANASMARAIAEVSVARGVDPRDCALVAFGGAAGQHACSVARALSMRTILLHPLAGVLSAYGIGVADVTWDGQRDAGRTALPRTAPIPPAVRNALHRLAESGRAALAREGADPEQIKIEPVLDLRYAGTETAIPVAEPEDGDWHAAFARQHRALFGYDRPDRDVEITTARARARAPQTVRDLPPPPAGTGAREIREELVWFPGCGRVPTPVYAREELAPGVALSGPALVLEDTGTLVIEPEFRAEVLESGILSLTDEARAPSARKADLSRADPIRLEVFGNRFMSIAEQMGAVLRNTSVSTNIKERLDYSCAVFDSEGGLVANAPHIPVHLGAMSETVRVVQERFRDLREGDVIVTNDPSAGGSHLPDVTAVTPVFTEAEAPQFFVASRGHHADIGGISPGSMPANSHRLEEEGVLLEPFRLVRDGHFDEDELLRRLTRAPYPARTPADNVAELEAMVAANRAGVWLLREMVTEQGEEAVAVTMRQLQEAAAGKVAREIGRLPDGEHRFEDRLDDGTPVCVRLLIEGERMTVDFTGTGPAQDGNLNAPRAVVQSAVIYVLRTLVAERIPLNGGCLAPVAIHVPAGSLLDPPFGAAVVGGNVETSQRIVDVLLGALGIAAASQGTMNNVAFGDEHFGYYETIGGGAGAGDGYPGASAVHTHMTNTRITDAEILETRYPVRIDTFAIRRGSGGAGRWRGGDGVVRRYLFDAPVSLSLLSERRVVPPWGQRGGAAGAVGRNRVLRRDGRIEDVGGRCAVSLEAGDGLCVETPGGGGFGAEDS